MKLPIEHSCFAQHLNEKKPKKCRCRKRITLAEATTAVEKGFAQWLVISSTIALSKEICSLCLGGPFKKSCQHCKGLGEIYVPYEIKISSNDVVLVTTGSTNDSGGLVYRSVKAKKTPRVATIEKAHIERAYVDGVKEEQERIEAYGLMTLESRIEMGIGVEPLDDLATGIGRIYDRGRSPFARISDERTRGGIGSRIRTGFNSMDQNDINDELDREEK
jgi:hypothetical protein